jgi:hypothetical protein
MLPYIAVLCRAVVIGFIAGRNPPISLRVSSPLPPRGTEERRSVCIPASALAAGSSGTLLFGITLDQFGGTSQLAPGH